MNYEEEMVILMVYFKYSRFDLYFNVNGKSVFDIIILVVKEDVF